MPSSVLIDFEEAGSRDWDVIIVGAGMGGGSAAYQLAIQGKSVLLVEKGLACTSQYRGVEIEQEDPDERLENGKWPTRLTATVDGKSAAVWAPLGCGVGGSTLLYAAALQRLQREDFAEQQLPGGGSVAWPFSYDELQPYYQQIEALFSVCGTPDPLAPQDDYTLLPPPAMCPADQHFFQQFQQGGLHPHRLHVGVKYQHPCFECGGHVCQKNCKQDANNACIQPALKTGNLSILAETEVVRLEADAKRVKQLVLKCKTSTFTLEASIIILAAGAYFTPVILQRSRNRHWPQGLANNTDRVGRNLMFHASDFIAFWPGCKVSRQGPNKTIALRDFYRHGKDTLGEFQSTGLAAGYGHVVYALRLMFDQSRFKKLSFIRHLLRVPAYIAAKLLGEATIFTTIVEDYPYLENRVLLDDATASGMRFEYTVQPEFRTRVHGLKTLIRKRLSHLRSLPMTTGISLNYGHPCGTCKAGDDPATSVVDANCKAHGIDNLYIVDASFMPTSGGTNPSLTVAANGLRVADKIVAVLDKKSLLSQMNKV